MLGVPADAVLLLAVAIGVASASMGVILGYSGLAKLRDSDGVAKIFGGYAAVPDSMARPMARIVPTVEIATALGLSLPLTHRFGAVAAAIFFSGAALVVGVSLIVGRVPPSCGCLGPRIQKPPSWGTVLRLSLLAMTSGMMATPALAYPSLPSYFLGILLAITFLVVLSVLDQLRLIRNVLAAPHSSGIIEVTR